MNAEINCEIAGISVEISGVLPAGTLAALSPYEIVKPAGLPELRISCSEETSISAEKLDSVYGVRHYIEEYGLAASGFLSQDRSGGASLATIRYFDDFRRAECALVDVEADGGAPLASRMMVAIGTSVLNMFPALGAVTYHSSCIMYRGGALLFAAPSGTGKSTQSSLWKNAFPGEVAYINDDTPILKKVGGEFRAYGSPWAGSSGINSNISAPVRAIVCVSRAEKCRAERIEPQEAAVRALCSARAQLFPPQRLRQMDVLFDLASAVPFYELECDPSPRAVEALHRALYG